MSGYLHHVSITCTNLVRLKRIGITHFALIENELTQTRIDLLAAGVPCSEIKHGRMGLFSYFFAVDPDGNYIEFIGESLC